MKNTPKNIAIEKRALKIITHVGGGRGLRAVDSGGVSPLHGGGGGSLRRNIAVFAAAVGMLR